MEREKKECVNDGGESNNSKELKRESIVMIDTVKSYSVLEVAKVLMVAHDGFCTILNEMAKEPQTQSWIAIILDHIHLWEVRCSAHLPGLAHNQVHTFVKVRLQCREGHL